MFLQINGHERESSDCIREMSGHVCCLSLLPRLIRSSLGYEDRHINILVRDIMSYWSEVGSFF